MSSLKDKLAAAYDGSEKDTSDYKQYNKTGDPKFIDDPDELEKEDLKSKEEKQEEEIKETPKHDSRIQYGNETYSTNSYQPTQAYDSHTSYNTNSFSNLENDKNNYSVSSNDISPEIIKKTLTLYEDIRRLDNNQKTMLFSILDVKTIENAIYESINGDRSSVNSITDLIDLYKQQSVERAFNLMSMDTRDLKDIESLTVSILNKEEIEIDVERDKINYCRELETEINKLSQDVMKNLEPISKILQKGLD